MSSTKYFLSTLLVWAVCVSSSMAWHKHRYAGGVYMSPVYQTPVYQAPVLQTPVYQAPVYQTPVFQAPVYQSPVYQSPVYQTPVYQTPTFQSPVYQTPVYQTPTYQTPASPNQQMAFGFPGSIQGIIGFIQILRELKEIIPERDGADSETVRDLQTRLTRLETKVENLKPADLLDSELTKLKKDMQDLKSAFNTQADRLDTLESRLQALKKKNNLKE